MAYTLVRRTRSRHLRVTVRPDGVRVSAPPRHARREVEAFLRSRSGWVLEHLDRLAATAPPPLADGAVLPLLDGAVELGLRPGARSRWRFRAEDARLAVEVAAPGDVERVVESWYRSRAADWFRARADARAARARRALRAPQRARRTHALGELLQPRGPSASAGG